MDNVSARQVDHDQATTRLRLPGVQGLVELEAGKRGLPAARLRQANYGEIAGEGETARVTGAERDRFELPSLGIEISEYAAAGIPEYWLIDPTSENVTVFVLEDDANLYSDHGVYGSGQEATSVSLLGFTIDVQTLFARDL